MKSLLLILAFFFVSISCYSQIVSTEKGGNWNDPKTWVNSIIPTQTDDVIINGNVLVSTSINCKNVLISEKGILEFIRQEKTTQSLISEILTIKGFLKIGTNCELSVKKNIIKDKNNIANIENLGSIIVGE